MESQKDIKVTIVGDYLVFRNGLKMLLRSKKGIQVVADVSDLSQVPVSVENMRPDVLLVNASELESKEFEKFMRDCALDVPKLILTNSKNAASHQRYLLLGASGVVSKEQSSEVLFKAIEKVCEDDLWFRRDVMKSSIRSLLRDKHSPKEDVYRDKYESLTVREKEVLSKVCLGYKNKMIAESLFITETTVRHHLTSIFEKLNVKSRLALAITAFNNRLVEIPSEIREG